MPTTRKSHPTACRGLNKTNCIFPCKYAEKKLNQQHSYCYATIKRKIKHAKTEKEKKSLISKGKKITKKLNRAKQNMKKVNKDVESAAKDTSILSGITGFFTPKPKSEVEEEPKPVEVEVEEEPKPESEEEPKPESEEPVATTEIEPAVETEEEEEEKKNE